MSFFGLFGSKSEKIPCGVTWSSGMVQVLCLTKDSTVISYGEALLEPGVVINSCVADAPKLAAKIAEAMKNAVPNPIDPKSVLCVTCMPDNCTYIVPLNVDSSKSKEEVASAISAHITDTIPVPSTNILASYYPLPFKKEPSILYVGVLWNELQKIHEVFKLAGTDFAGAEPCAFAINRAYPGQEASVVLSLTERSVIATFRDTNRSVLWSFSMPFDGIVDDAFSVYLLKEVTDGIAYIENNLAGHIDACILSGSELKPLEEKLSKELNRKIIYGDAPQSIKNIEILTNQKNAFGPVLLGLALKRLENGSGMNFLIGKK